MRRNELPLELEGADNPDGEEHPGRGLDELGSELDDDLEAALERGESDWEAVEGSDDDGRAPGGRLDADEPDDGDSDAAGVRSDAAAVGRCCPAVCCQPHKETGGVDVHAQGVQAAGCVRPSATW